MNEIILLSGWKRSGKDTSAEYLEGRYGYTQLSIAEPLKASVSKKYGIPRWWLEDQEKKEEGIARLPVVDTDDYTAMLHRYMRDSFVRREGTQLWTPRALCILEGSITRSVDPLYWVRQLAQGIRQNDGTYFVVSDVRYRSEIEYLKVQFPTCRTVRICREDTSPTTDPSERDLDRYTFDEVVYNRGTRGQLYETLDKLVARLRSNERSSDTANGPVMDLPTNDSAPMCQGD